MALKRAKGSTSSALQVLIRPLMRGPGFRATEFAYILIGPAISDVNSVWQLRLAEVGPYVWWKLCYSEGGIFLVPSLTVTAN